MLASPKTEMRAGMRSGRTKNVSRRTPTLIMNANSRKASRGTMARTAKEPASAIPAMLIAFDARGTATATASRKGRSRSSSQIRPTT
jgi:hypothetical protein